MFAIRVHDVAFSLSLLFFGLHLVLAGYLISRPPIAVLWLAIVLEITGVCYLVNTLSALVAPPVHAVLYPWVLLPAFFGEIGLTFWLLFTRRFSAADQTPRLNSV